MKSCSNAGRGTRRRTTTSSRATSTTACSSPSIGYGIKGAIWYQGETNAGRAYQYRDLFPLMIKNWRDEWGIGDFPFYYVQLADFMGEIGRAAGERLGRASRGADDDHGQAAQHGPGRHHRHRRGRRTSTRRNKEDVGKRLARWALAKDYGVNIAYQSPTYKSMEVKDGKVARDVRPRQRRPPRVRRPGGQGLRRRRRPTRSSTGPRRKIVGGTPSS